MIVSNTELHDRVYSVSFEEAVKSDSKGKYDDEENKERDYDWFSKVRSLLANDQLMYYCLSCGAFNRKATMQYDGGQTELSEGNEQESLYNFEESEEGVDLKVIGWDEDTPIYNQAVNESTKYRCECGAAIYGTDLDSHAKTHKPEKVTLTPEEP